MQNRMKKKLVKYNERQLKDKDTEARMNTQTTRKKRWTGSEMVKLMAEKKQGLKGLGSSIPPNESNIKQGLVLPPTTKIVSEGTTRNEENSGTMENSSRGGFWAKPGLEFRWELRAKGAGMTKAKDRIKQEKVKGGVRAKLVMTRLWEKGYKGQEQEGDHSYSVEDIDKV